MNRPPLVDSTVACRVSIRGIVQGVGFRPFVFRAAASHGVVGWVLNGHAGVEVHAEGSALALRAFLDELRATPPDAARIAQFDVCTAEPLGLETFEIRASDRQAAPTTRISPDLAICADCLREMNEPGDRRRHYPYINCTNCGPRYSIIRQLPYDRHHTSLAGWPLCADCLREFEDPLDRRYHAQATACPACGPAYHLVMDDIAIASGEEAVRAAVRQLAEGRIVAVKGIGGYHLATDANNATAVATLRARKYRQEKPFALLVRDVDEARRIVALSPAHERALLDIARPIVLAPAKVVLPHVAPDNRSLGVMLPYAPLHFQLFEFGAPSPLVLTSANRSSEPIAYRDDDARSRLTGIADSFLIGERPIVRRVDDSVVTIRMGRPASVRRARGYAPGAVCTVPGEQPILALGADLKNTIALAVGGEVFVSQHLGDLGDAETNLAFEETVRDLLSMYDIDEQTLTVVHDLHPEFHSTRYAAKIGARRRIAVQHHRAHIASVLAEHQQFDEHVIGVAFDGTGYGDDGSNWGGEVFTGSLRDGFQRCAWLRSVRMPGGDAAARFPVQAAAGFLANFDDLPDLSAAPFWFPARFAHATALVAKNLRCFATTSMGRLFDAIAALLGFTRETTFEGQAAIWLEQRALEATRQLPYPFPQLDHRPLLRAILADRLAGRPIEEIASAFHSSVAVELAATIRRISAESGLRTVVLSGGVFQNEILSQWLDEELKTIPGLRLLTNEQVPVNDGGISLGQAAMAAMAIQSESP